MTLRIESQGINIEHLAPKPAAAGSSFMDVLKQEFDHVTSKLQDVPGMSGVYVVNQPQQTLDSLNISSVI